MKKLILFISYFLILTVFCKAQVNLVSNPSFENLSQCPSTFSQLEYAIPWFQPYVDSNGVQQSSTDLFSSCCSGFCGVINNSKGSQVPRNGDSYAGAYYYLDFDTAREFIEVKLNDSLLSNRDYCMTFHVSLADKCKYATSNFGAYFSNDSCLSPYIIPPYTPQVENSFNNVITDKNNWIPIESIYTAQGEENFITIGGFSTDDLSNIVIVSGSSLSNISYYYIDDVSVIDISTPAYAGVDTTITIGDSVFIGRTPEIGLNDDCVWYVNSNPVDTVAGLWVMPDSTTTYILEQTICGYTTYDTVTITVLPTSINELFKENNLKIFPNPSTGDVWIKLDNNLTVQSKVIIYDIVGKIVFEKNILIDNNTKITPNLQRGTYFISINPNNNNIKPFNGKISFMY